MPTTPSATKVVTGRVRLSYFHGFEPWAQNPGQEPKYSTAILIPKSDKATIKKLRAAQAAALEAGKDRTFGGKVPAAWKDTIHDGDEEADLEKNPEYAGHLYLSASSKMAPGIVDQGVQPILDSSRVYSGCYARVSLNAFPYSQQGNKGVSFGLGNIQLLEEGESLGGGRSKAEDDFDDELDDLI